MGMGFKVHLSQWTRFKIKILAVLSLSVILTPLPFASQGSAAEKTIGVIMTGDIPYYRDVHTAFMARLGREGYADRVEVIMQKPYPDPISLSNAARKLIAVDADIIVAYGAPAAFAVFREKPKIPMVYGSVYEPLAAKITAKNTTGISSRISVSSLLRYLRGIAPITNLGVIYSANEEDSVYQTKELLKLSDQYGFKIAEINLKRPQDTKAMLSGKKLDAIFITGSAIANMASSSIMEFSRNQRIPTASLLPDKSYHAIVTLCPSPRDLGEKIAEKVIKVLNNVSPERIKVDSSSDTELIFNLREAKDMGFKIPMNLVTEATRLIQ